MKKAVFAVVFIFPILIGQWNYNNWNKSLLLMEEAGISIYLSYIEQRALFKSVQYDFVHGNIVLETTKSIDYIQITNELGKLEFQLPVLSKHVQMKKNLFFKGKFVMAIKVRGQKEFEFLNIEVNE